MIRFAGIALLAFLPGCATVVSGTTDVVAVESYPPGASCSVARAGATVATITMTPGVMSVGKSGSPLEVTCRKPGYQAGAAVAASSFNGWTFGNLVIGGLIGVVVDASTGANFTYPPSVVVALAPSPDAGPLQLGPQHDAVAARPGIQPAPILRRVAASEPPTTMVTARVMSMPDGSNAKRSFLLGACSAGDVTACLLTQRGWPNASDRSQAF